MNAVSPFAPRSVPTTDIVLNLSPRPGPLQHRRPEHVPVDAYHLLRRLAQGPVALHHLQGIEIEAALVFLVSRELARRHAGQLAITPGGRRIGQVADDSIVRSTETEQPGSGPLGLKRWLR